MLRILIAGATALTLAACDIALLAPGTGLDVLPDGLTVRLTVEPDVVQPHEPFIVRLEVTNNTSGTLTVVTPYGCLAVPEVRRDGNRVPFRGSALACTAAITTHTFPPGETRVVTWDMEAELYAQSSGDVDGAPAPAGLYRVRVVFETMGGDDVPRSASVERTLRVQ